MSQLRSGLCFTGKKKNNARQSLSNSIWHLKEQKVMGNWCRGTKWLLQCHSRGARQTTARAACSRCPVLLAQLSPTALSPDWAPPVLQGPGQFQLSQAGSSSALFSSHTFQHEVSSRLVWITRCSSFPTSLGQQGWRNSPHHCSRGEYRWFENLCLWKREYPASLDAKTKLPPQETVSHGSWVTLIWHICFRFWMS